MVDEPIKLKRQRHKANRTILEVRLPRLGVLLDTLANLFVGLSVIDLTRNATVPNRFARRTSLETITSLAARGATFIHI